MTITPASIRTNNPGAMYPGPSAKRFGSKTFQVLKSKDGTHKIACFDDPVHGAAAQFDLLSSPKYTGRTVRQAITKWCGGFYASTYLNVLAQNSGVTADTMLTPELIRNPDVAIPLAKAMALQEAGRPFPLDDDGWRRAHQLAFGVVLEPVAFPSVVAEQKTPTETFSVDNPLPAPKPETRVATMKAASRKWAVVTALRRWFVGLPAAGLALSETGLPTPDIPAMRESIDAVQSVVSSFGKLGIVGWLLILFIALGAVQKFMVEDAEEGRSEPKGP